MTKLRAGLIAPLLCLACRGTSGSIAPGSAPAGGSPVSSSQMIYVSDEESGEITIIDGSTDSVVATLPVGKRPRGIQVSRDGKLLYVAVSGNPSAPPGTDESKLPPPDRSADGIAVIDLASRTLVRTLPTGEDPESFDCSADGKTLYVSNEDAAKMSIVDLLSGRVTGTVPVGGEPEGVRLRPDGKVVYITSEEENEVAAIALPGNKVIATVKTGPRPRAIAFSPDGSRAYVTCEQGSSVTVVDAWRHASIAEISIDAKGARPMGVAVSADGQTVYVSCGRGGTIAIIDATTDRVVRIIGGVGARPWGIGLTRDGRKLYTANGPSNDVSVIDVASGTVVKRIPAGRSPWGIALSR